MWRRGHVLCQRAPTSGSAGRPSLPLGALQTSTIPRMLASLERVKGIEPSS